MPLLFNSLTTKTIPISLDFVAQLRKQKPNIECVEKNNKDMLMRKLALCQRTYDYKDETKDVKQKVSFPDLNLFFSFSMAN